MAGHDNRGRRRGWGDVHSAHHGGAAGREPAAPAVRRGSDAGVVRDAAAVSGSRTRCRVGPVGRVPARGHLSGARLWGDRRAGAAAFLAARRRRRGRNSGSHLGRHAAGECAAARVSAPALRSGRWSDYADRAVVGRWSCDVAACRLLPCDTAGHAARTDVCRYRDDRRRRLRFRTGQLNRDLWWPAAHDNACPREGFGVPVSRRCADAGDDLDPRGVRPGLGRLADLRPVSRRRRDCGLSTLAAASPCGGGVAGCRFAAARTPRNGCHSRRHPSHKPAGACACLAATRLGRAARRGDARPGRSAGSAPWRRSADERLGIDPGRCDQSLLALAAPRSDGRRVGADG